MRKFVDEHSRHSDLTESLGFSLGAGRGKVLFQLRTGPLTHRQLAERNQTTGPYISLIVDKLEEHGLVQRGPHPDDAVASSSLSLPAGSKPSPPPKPSCIARRSQSPYSRGRAEELIELVQRVLDADDGT